MPTRCYRFGAIATIVCLGLGMTLAAQSGRAADQTLVVGLVAEPVNLDCAQVTDFNSTRAGRRILEALVDFDEQTTDLVPGLAQAWTISKDGLEYTFKLRPGITFHDGTPLNAETVRFSFDRQINDDAAAHKLGWYPYGKTFFGTIKSVAVVDDLTVKFTLSEPRASFIGALALAAGGIVSPTAFAKLGKDFATRPVGTGPFQYANWEHGTQIVMERNPHYWRGGPRLQKIAYRWVADDQTRLAQLQNGTLDLVVDVPADSIAGLEKDPRVTVLKQAGMHVWYVGINTTHGPLRDKRVRQALNYAVDKAAITRDVLKGTGVPSISPINPGTWGFEPAVPRYDYNPAMAKKLLAEAGYPNGFTVNFWTPESGSGMQAPVAISTVIQANLQAVGVQAKIQAMEWGAFLKRLTTREQDLFALSWAAGLPDPDFVLYPLLHSSQWTPNGPNRALYKNERFDAMLDAARKLTDIPLRKRLYSDAQKILVDEAPWIFIDHQIQVMVTKASVKGFRPHPNFDTRLTNVYRQ